MVPRATNVVETKFGIMFALFPVSYFPCSLCALVSSLQVMVIFFYRTQLLRLFRNGWRATICGAKLKTTYGISIKKSCFFLLQLNYLIDYYVVVPSFTPLGSDCSELFLRPGSEG